MFYYEVAPRKLIRSDSQSFTFHHDTQLPLGSIVLVEIGKATLPGLVIESVKKPSYKTKPITKLIEPAALPVALIKTALWLKGFYATPLGTVLQSVLPAGLQKSRRSSYEPPKYPSRNRTNIVFTTDQKRALSEIEATKQGTILLHGVTGSGKTTIYIESAKQALAAEQSAIILVPEIALTSQLVAEFSKHFPDVIVTHSRQTEAERHLAWREALNSDKPRVVIGPRSAIFMPLQAVGLIVLDEFHEPSFKQEQAPRYSTVQLASILAKHHHARLLLGSATPPISDYYIAKHHQRPVIELSKPAQKSLPPTVTLVDMTKSQTLAGIDFCPTNYCRRLIAL